MALRLLEGGFALRVHNRSPGRTAPLLAAGARAAASVAEAVAGADLVCLCLRDDLAVRQVLFGPGDQAAVATLEPGALVIDFSTIAPATSRELADELAAHGVAYLDAPVTGGTEGARAGRLSVLVGGAADQLERARPLLEQVGQRITHFGPVGTGQQVKALNQVMVAGSYAALAEALALGRRLGLPMEEVCAALAGGAAGSWALQHRAANMLRDDFPLGFRLDLHRKDLAIAQAEAAAVGQSLPVSERVAALEDDLIAAGFGAEDVSALARWFA
jgi:3-hydroxyisobutyrate dehydrogenase-like beta-hydroxyacid dehydrogenase